jgi:predicted Zn finger-like uncharacterized protein
MNVTCDACKTVFKVDDSRIPSKGIRVRCSKCQHVFMVTREVSEDFLSELSDFEKSLGGPTDEAPADTIDEKPAGGPEEAPSISFEEFMSKEGLGTEPDEVELPGEEPISEEFDQPEEVLGDQIPAEREVSEAIDAKLAPTSEDATGVSFEDFMVKEGLGIEPDEVELPGEGPVPQEFGQLEEPSPEKAPTGGTMADRPADEPASISDEPADTSFEDFLSREEPGPGVESAELPDESSILGEVEQPERPPEEETDSMEVDLQSLPPSEPGDVVVAAPEGHSKEEGDKELSVEAFIKEEMERESEAQGREAALPSLKHKKIEDLMRGKRRGRGSVRRRSSFRVVLLLILLLIVGAVAYLWWQNQGAPVTLLKHIGPTLENAVEKASGLWEDVIGFRKEDLELSGLQGSEDMIGPYRIYIIRGNVANKSRRARKYVKLRVVILDQVGNRMKEKEIFCGNVFTREELEKLAPEFLTGDQALQPKRPNDMVLEANGTISFMAIFSGLPREGKSFKVEKLEAPGV